MVIMLDALVEIGTRTQPRADGWADVHPTGLATLTVRGDAEELKELTQRLIDINAVRFVSIGTMRLDY
jgi:hypothetical protein